MVEEVEGLGEGEGRWARVVAILDSLDKQELDMFLVEVEASIEARNAEFPPEACEACDKTFMTVESLVKHIEREHQEDVKDCPVCSEALLGTTLAEHMADVHGVLRARRVVLESSHSCSICHETFVSELALKRHVKKIHSEMEFKMECSECFAQVTDLNTHMKSHQEKRFSCEVCHKKYRTKFDLKTHMNSVHLKVLDTCPHCGRQTANLNKHIYGNHTNEFSCNICGKLFARQTQLNYHMKAHERGTIVEKAGPNKQKERKRLANQKYLEKRRVRKELDADLHEHEKNLKRIWARKNREKLMKYKKEYNQKKRSLKVSEEMVDIIN